MNDNIFYNHLLHKQNLVPIINPNTEEAWTSVFVALCFLTLMIVKWSVSDKMNKITYAIFKPQSLSKLEQEEVNPFKLDNMALNLFFVANIAFLAYKLNSVYHLVSIGKTNFATFSFFIAPIALLFILRYFSNKLIAFFTNEYKILNEYTASCTLINQSMGLFLFPFLVVAEFSSFNSVVFIYAALAVLAGSILFRWYRGVVIGLLQQRVGLLQTFSYFCALEILPILVLVKFVIETF